MIDLLCSNNDAFVGMSLILALSNFPLGAASNVILYVNSFTTEHKAHFRTTDLGKGMVNTETVIRIRIRTRIQTRTRTLMEVVEVLQVPQGLVDRPLLRALREPHHQ